MKRRQGNELSMEFRRGIALGLRALQALTPALPRRVLSAVRRMGPARRPHANAGTPAVVEVAAGSQAGRRTAILAAAPAGPSSRPRGTAPRAHAISAAALRQAVRDVTLAGLDETEVRRHMVALGARWISTQTLARPMRISTTDRSGETHPVGTAIRTMRLTWPVARSRIGALFTAPATILIHFDADGRATGGGVSWPKAM